MLILPSILQFELARDAKIVQSLRELLFVARLWYRQNKLVLPQMFHKTQSVDVWAQIYKLLTRVAQILPGEPDSTLIGKTPFSLFFWLALLVQPIYLFLFLSFFLFALPQRLYWYGFKWGIRNLVMTLERPVVPH